MEMELISHRLAKDIEYPSIDEQRELEGAARQAQDLQHLIIEERRDRVAELFPCRRGRGENLQTKKTFDQVVHATQCQLCNCKSPNCITIKHVFFHDTFCKSGVEEHCYMCKLMWHLLKLHAQECQESSHCSVPHCKDLKLRKTYDSIVHAVECRTPLCKSQHCFKVKELIHHGMTCKILAGGGCGICMEMWQLLKHHAKGCKESNCNVLCCSDLKEYLRRKKHEQSDSQGTHVAVAGSC